MKGDRLPAYNLLPSPNSVPTKIYIGSTQDFKPRLANHQASFRHEKLKYATALSRHVWEKNIGHSPEITWKGLARCYTYVRGSRYCDLCLTEKLAILRNAKDSNSLNLRQEAKNKFAHIFKHRLNQLKQPT